MTTMGGMRAGKTAAIKAAQLIRARAATLDDDRLFWLQFSFNERRAFDRILCRKVGDAATFAIELGWASHTDSPIADLAWKRPKQPYPATDGNLNPTMHIVDMDPGEEAKLAMLMHHEAFDEVRRQCQDMHNNALLCRAQAERAGLT